MSAGTGAPEWLVPVVGAVVAALGYVGKLLMELLRDVIAARNARRARLVELLALIRAGDAAFGVQVEVRDRLHQALKRRGIDVDDTYDRTFSAAFDSMDPKERELFDVVRAYTVHTFKPLNDKLLSWLAADTDFRVGPQRGNSDEARLTEYLGKLEAHLLLWQAKYSAWIPDHPNRALVYLADEERHGTPFPKGGAAIVAAVLGAGDQKTARSP